MNKLQLEPRHWDIIKTILKKYDLAIYAFGSRVKHTAKPSSDLDLCIKSPIDFVTLGKLQMDFEESNLPFTVDIILWDKISENFKSHIEKDLVQLTV